jgi:hypothetical protein
VAGFPGTGRTTAVKNFLEEVARTQSVPSDWCYVNNFSNQYEPKAIKLPPGKGKDFQKDMKDFIDNARRNLPKAFESGDYAVKREATIQALEGQRKALIDRLNSKARDEGFIIQSTPIGLLLIPVIKGQPVSDQGFLTLPPKIREEIQEKRSLLESELRSAMRQLMDMERKIHEEIEKMNRDIAIYAIGNLVTDLMEKYKDFPAS